ncbi:MAG TPA: hypothetical protein DIT91_00325 [Actinobacteria bacterium]|nr:hypothetical protein [Actinomycetota bacterium]
MVATTNLKAASAKKIADICTHCSSKDNRDRRTADSKLLKKARQKSKEIIKRLRFLNKRAAVVINTRISKNVDANQFLVERKVISLFSILKREANKREYVGAETRMLTPMSND